jgi:hypothetical protein
VHPTNEAYNICSCHKRQKDSQSFKSAHQNKTSGRKDSSKSEGDITNRQNGGGPTHTRKYPPPSQEDIKNSLNRTCFLCKQLVYENKKPFGIFPSCDCPFCLECIKQWKATTAANAASSKSSTTKTQGTVGKNGNGSSAASSISHHLCPGCMILSSFIIPSKYYYPQNSQGKENLIKNHKLKIIFFFFLYFLNFYLIERICH